MPPPLHLRAILDAAEHALLVPTPESFDSAQVYLAQAVQSLTDQPELRRDPAVLRAVTAINLLADQAARLRMGRQNWSIEA